MSDEWSRIDHRCKPSKAAGQDDLRPVLRHGCITKEGEDYWLSATDSYICIRIPIEAKSELPEGCVPVEFLRALDRSPSGRFRPVPDAEDSFLEVEGVNAQFPLISEGQFPNTRELVPEDSGEIGQITVNPILLGRLAAAMGCPDHFGVRLEFRHTLRSIVVRMVGSDSVGLLMPIRETE